MLKFEWLCVHVTDDVQPIRNWFCLWFIKVFFSVWLFQFWFHVKLKRFCFFHRVNFVELIRTIFFFSFSFLPLFVLVTLKSKWPLWCRTSAITQRNNYFFFHFISFQFMCSIDLFKFFSLQKIEFLSCIFNFRFLLFFPQFFYHFYSFCTLALMRICSSSIWPWIFCT